MSAGKRSCPELSVLCYLGSWGSVCIHTFPDAFAKNERARVWPSYGRVGGTRRGSQRPFGRSRAPSTVNSLRPQAVSPTSPSMPPSMLWKQHWTKPTKPPPPPVAPLPRCPACGLFAHLCPFHTGGPSTCDVCQRYIVSNDQWCGPPMHNPLDRWQRWRPIPDGNDTILPLTWERVRSSHEWLAAHAACPGAPGIPPALPQQARPVGGGYTSEDETSNRASARKMPPTGHMYATSARSPASAGPALSVVHVGPRAANAAMCLTT